MFRIGCLFLGHRIEYHGKGAALVRCTRCHQLFEDVYCEIKVRR